MRFRRLSSGAWKISPCNTYLPAAPGYVMVESRQLARLKAERQKNHQLKVRMSDSIKQNSQFSLPLNFAPTTGTTACEAIHWTPSMDTLPRPALAPPPSPATTPSPATAPAETPGPVSAMSASLSVPPAPAASASGPPAAHTGLAHGASKSRPVVRGRVMTQKPLPFQLGLEEVFAIAPGVTDTEAPELCGSHGPACHGPACDHVTDPGSGSSATRARIVIRTRPI